MIKLLSPLNRWHFLHAVAKMFTPVAIWLVLFGIGDVATQANLQWKKTVNEVFEGAIEFLPVWTLSGVCLLIGFIIFLLGLHAKPEEKKYAYSLGGDFVDEVGGIIAHFAMALLLFNVQEHFPQAGFALVLAPCLFILGKRLSEIGEPSVPTSVVP